MGSVIFFLILFFIIIPKLQRKNAQQRAEEQRRARARRAAQNSAAQAQPAAPAAAPKYQQNAQGAAAQGPGQKRHKLWDGQDEQALERKKVLGLAAGIGGAALAALCALGFIGSLATFVESLVYGYFFADELVAPVMFALCAAGGGLLSYQGFGAHRRAKDFVWYRSIIGGRRECPVEDIARATGRSPRRVVRDLQKMVRHGYFPLGFVDEATACFYADNDAYRESQERRAVPDAAGAAVPSAVRPEAQPAAAGDAGDAQLLQYKRQAERVAEPAIREKAMRLYEHAEDIFAWVRLHPECTEEVRRFCNYYLPTANKLLSTYNEVAPHKEDSRVAAGIESEVSRVLDTMTTAFRGLMDHLLQNTAVDMQAEISALETVLAQEGLTQDGFAQSGEAP